MRCMKPIFTYSATLVIFRIHHPKNVFKFHTKDQYIVMLVYVASLEKLTVNS